LARRLALAARGARAYGWQGHRHRRRARSAVHHLLRDRDRRSVEDGQQRHHVDAHLRPRGQRIARPHPRIHLPSRHPLARPAPDSVWVGTGEANGSSYASWGDGVHKTTDGGRTWSNMGLRDTHHVGRIVIHPSNPDVVYVAASGHLWGPNRERGLYRTTDGG